MAKTKTDTAEQPLTAAPPTVTNTKNTGNKSQIYVGASLPGIKSHTVFCGKIPEVLDKPFVKELVLPLEKLTDFERNVKIERSREAYCYKKSAELAARLMEDK